MCSWDWFSMKLLNYFACRPMGFDHKNECFEDPSMSINFQFRPARNYPCKTIQPNSLVSSRFPSKEIIAMPREDALAIEDSTEWFIFPPKAHSKLRQSHGQVSGQTNERHPLSEQRSIITERRDRAWKNETSDKPDSRWRVRKSTKEKPEQREREEERDQGKQKADERSERSAAYRKRPREVGVTEAVGEEFEDKDSWGEEEPNAMIDEGADASVTDKSLFNSSLLLRETDRQRTDDVDHQ